MTKRSPASREKQRPTAGLTRGSCDWKLARRWWRAASSRRAYGSTVFARIYGSRTAGSRAEIRASLGLPTDRPIMLVMGGGLGLGPVATTARALAELDRPVTAVVIVGRNARLKRQVEESALDYPYKTRVLGFVDNVADYMRASDILLTKPGGLTTTEALAAEVPMILVRPLPGQEQRNARFLAQRGAALRADRSADIARCVEELLDDRAVAARVHAAVRRLRKLLAAETIAGRIADLGAGAATRYAYGG